MTIDRGLSEIRAEVLLNYLYPEMEERWTAHCDGCFYRNYNGDAMLVDETTGEVRLSRDGFLRLLPQGLITRDEDLRGEGIREKSEQLNRRVHRLHEAFLPFDTFMFQKRLAIERQVSELLSGKIAWLLKAYFGYDIDEETSPLVREAAVLLPFISSYKGDLGFVARLLETLTGYEVEMHTGRYSQTDSSRSWLPRVRYDLLIPGLSAAGYREHCNALAPLACFIKEWLIPFDIHCEIAIVEPLPRQGIGDRLILDYNSELRTKR